MNRKYPEYSSYKVPEKNLLVLSCMDLRLSDDLVHFLHFDNLTNRYDHVISPGVALCHCAADKKLRKKHFKDPRLPSKK